MAASLGTLTLDLVARIASFTDPLRQAEQQSRTSTSAIERHAENTTASLKSMAVASLGFLSAGALFSAYVKNTQDAENEQAQLASTLESTAFAAKFSQDQLNDMSAAMSALSTVSGGEITQAQTTLLAFTGIVGNEFPRALQAAIDMATRTGTSVVSAAETIGRALDVPSQGLSALSKQGFRFTEDQKVLAKQLEDTGRTAEAQAIILNELENSYGGAAAAARDTFTGALISIKNAANDLLTGDGSLELAKDVLNGVTDALARPEARQALEALTVAAVGYAIVMAGRVVASNVAASISFIAAQREVLRYNAALAAMAGMSTRAAAAQTLLGTATRGAGAVLGVFGGPLGLAATVGISAAAYLLLRDNSSAADLALESSAKYADITTQSFKNLKGAQQDVIKSDLQDAFNTQGAELDRLANRYASLTDELVFYAKQQGLGSKYAGDFIEIQKGVRNGTIAYADALDRLNSMEFLTTAQKKQALDAIDAYNKQYGAVVQTGNSLDAVGAKYTIAGSAAQNAASGITASGNAAAVASEQVDGLSKSMQDYIDKTEKGIFNNKVYLRLRELGQSPAMAQGLTDAVAANDGKPISVDTARLVNESVTLNEAVAASKAKVATASKAAAKGESEAQKAAKKALEDQNKLLERQTDLRKQIGTMYAPALEQNRFSYDDAKNDILGAGFDTKDQEKYLGLAKQFYQRIDDEYLKSLNLELMEFTATEQRKLDVAYGFDKKILVNRTDLLDTEKEARKEALDAAYNYQSQQIDLQNRKEILAVQEGYISQSEFVRQRYELEREEITKTIGKSDELKQKLIEASLFKESLERQGMRNALGDAQTNAAIGKYQRNDPNGYAQFDLQNQYDGTSGALLNTYGDAKDAINNDPALEQKDREQALLDAHQQYLDAKAAMDDEYNQRNRDLLISNQAETLGAYGSIFGDLSDLTKAYGGEQSKAFMLMSAAQKAFTLTSVLLSSADAIGKAWASAPFPANLGAVAIATAKTGALKAMVGAISPVGQAHDGIMEVPDSGTWNLQRGERVLPQKTAANLDRTLNQVKGGNGVTININNSSSADVSARQNPDGSITVDVVEKMIKRSWGNMSDPNSFESKQVQRNTTATRVR